MISLIIACDFGDTNIDSLLPQNAELNELLPSGQTQTVHNMVSIGARVSATVVQHFKGIDAQPSGYEQYLIDERTLNSFWRTGLYGGAMKDCHLIIEKAQVEDLKIYSGIAKTLLAFNLGLTTACWGDVPCSESLNGLDNLQPIYDTQEKIYFEIQTLLDEAILDFNEALESEVVLSDDLFFNGDASKWLGTAWALKARYYMQLSKRDLLAAEKAIEAIQSGSFVHLNDQPNFVFGNSINEAHPIALYMFERPGQFAMGDQLYNDLVALNDPRLYKLAVIEDNIPFFYQNDSQDLYWGQFDAVQPLISLSELRFIEAEAYLRLGKVAEAEQSFKRAVSANMEQLGIPFASYEQYIEAEIQLDNTGAFEDRLELIIKQKYLALFGQNAIESWVDYRRTGFPSLSVPTNANTSFNPSLVIPQRYLYPISERSTNEQNVELAIEQQGGHLLDDKLWAFK